MVSGKIFSSSLACGRACRRVRSRVGPAVCWPRPRHRSIITGIVRDSSGGGDPGRDGPGRQRATGVAVEAVSNEQGVLSRRRAGARPVPRGDDARRIRDGRAPDCARSRSDADDRLTLSPSRITEAVVVTARRVEEVAQEVPIPVSVVSGNLVADAGAFNVNRLKEQIPTVQFYSTNPRNSSVQIRGLGAPFGLTNDGIEPGVGLYIDGVFYARPASATLDFLDVEQVEVLRGPQGTLFGKNTTAGAINVTTRKPSFTPETEFELNYGNLGFVQAKGSITGRSSAGRSPGGCRSPAPSVTARSTTPRHTDDREQSQQSGRQGPVAVHAVGQRSRSRSRSTTRGSAPRATPRSSPALRPRCARRTGSSRRSRPISAIRLRASTPSTG